MTILLGIQEFLESRGDCHFPLGSDPSHGFWQAMAILRHEKLADYGRRPAPPRVTADQHWRMLRYKFPKESNRPQKDFRAISGTIDQLNDLNAIDANLLWSQSFHATIEA